MIRNLAPVLLLAAATVAGAQDGPRRFAVGRFDAVELASSDDVRIVPGDSVSVTASGDPQAVAALEIAVRGDTLHVGRRPGSWHDHGARVTVTMPTLRVAAISGSGDIRADAVAGRGIVGRIAGSGTLTLPALRVGTARFDLSGSGSIVAGGSAQSVAIDLSGSGRVDTQTLATPAIDVALGGSGAIVATASRTASIRTVGSGSVRIAGGAHCDVRNGAAATVRCG